jgi:hypothetical protein
MTTGVPNLGLSGAIDFIRTATRDRIDHYRRQAECLREMAAAEAIGGLRTNLKRIAREDDSLADSLEVKISVRN